MTAVIISNDSLYFPDPLPPNPDNRLFPDPRHPITDPRFTGFSRIMSPFLKASRYP